MLFTRKMPEFYIIIARQYFFWRGEAGTCSLLPLPIRLLLGLGIREDEGEGGLAAVLRGYYTAIFISACITATIIRLFCKI